MNTYPITEGPFKPTFESLKQYKCPEWFNDAKFGIWAHWGPQAVPCAGDWYARNMYMEGSRQYKYHLENYGHPSVFGYKDIVKLWKAENFDPAAMMKLYKKAGAKYFCALAVHHDNFDCWDSKHHAWNSVKMGPGKDIVGMWRKAALDEGLRFGISEHHERSYSWFNTNKGSDKEGPYAGVPYDGNDPLYEDFYHEKHDDISNAYPVNPSEKFLQNWYMRVKDVIENYKPDLIYMDGGIPFGEAGRAMMANYFNNNIKWHDGKLEAVHLVKDLELIFPDCVFGDYVEGIGVLDIESGVNDAIRSEPWQTDTYISDWMYNKFAPYKPTRHVINMLIDVVSKNGSLLLNLAPKPDGTLDDQSMNILNGIADWISINGEGIYGTRPWKVFGEGPTMTSTGAYKEKVADYTSSDYRFTKNGDVLYAFCLGWPDDGKLSIKSLAADGANKKINSAELLGFDGKLDWRQTQRGLEIFLPKDKPCEIAWTLKII